MTEKVKVGLFGVGHLGKIHAKLISEIPGFEWVGFFDPSDEAAFYAESNFTINRISSAEQLIEMSDAIVIASPTATHHEIATLALKNGKHVFVEKPLAENTFQASELAAIASEKDVKVMVGHVERYNPALLALNLNDVKPLFIEVHRLAQFNPRGTDVSVVYDLMIHDLDIILGLVNAEVESVSASGVSIVSKSADIANARIEFSNGCVANVTASRISMKNMRKMRIFQPDAYLSVDFLKGKSDVIKITDKQDGENSPGIEIDLSGTKKLLTMETLGKQDVNAIKMELEIFLDCIVNNKPVPVSAVDGFKAMQLAERILNAVESNSAKVSSALERA